MAGGAGRTLRIALVGEEAAGVQVLRMLVTAGHRVVVVFSGGESPAPGATVAGMARHHGLPVRPAVEVRDASVAALLRRERVDLLVNVHSLHIVHPDVLAAPSLGAFNLHPGPLPEYAGLHVPLWAILHGEERHGVTVHRMDPDVDAGPVTYQAAFPLRAQDTGLSVMTACVRTGLPLVERLVRTAAAGSPIPEQEQDVSRRRWFGPGPPEGGRLTWTHRAQRIVNFVRACDWGPFPSPWGRPHCWAGVGRLDVAAATTTGRRADAPAGTVGGVTDSAVLVAAADEWVRVDRVALGNTLAPAASVLRVGEVLQGDPGASTTRETRHGR